jgi:hypothetical protein
MSLADEGGAKMERPKLRRSLKSIGETGYIASQHGRIKNDTRGCTKQLS